MSIKRLPKIIDCDRIWADLVTVIYRLRGKPRVTYFVPPIPGVSKEMPKEVSKKDVPKTPETASNP